MSTTAKLMCITKIPYEVLDEGRVQDAFLKLVAEDILKTVMASVNKLRKRAALAGVKPSEYLETTFAFPDEPVVVEETEHVRVGIATHTEKPDADRE
jgi:hypothetical protein